MKFMHYSGSHMNKELNNLVTKFADDFVLTKNG